MTVKKQIIYLCQLAGIFILLGWLKHPFFFFPSIIILIISPFARMRLALIQGWQKLGELLGKILSPWVLSLIYYLFLTPLAFIRKAFGADALLLKKSKTSTLKEVCEKNQPQRFEELW